MVADLRQLNARKKGVKSAEKMDADITKVI